MYSMWRCRRTSYSAIEPAPRSKNYFSLGGGIVDKSGLAVNLERHAGSDDLRGLAPNEQATSPSGAPSLVEGTSCPGSLDVSITEELPNDFPALFAKYPSITHVFFNSNKAEAAFLPALRADRHVFARLPRWSLLMPGVGQLPEPDITSPNSFQVVPSNRSNCICLIGA